MTENKQRFSLIYFLSNSFFLASGYSLIFKTSNQDSWISMLIGTILGLIIIAFINKFILNKYNDENKSIFYKTLLSLFFIFIIFINILVARIFATSFFLIKTPGLMITIPFIILCYYASTKKETTISKISELILPISLFFIIFNMIAVSKDGNISSFLPLFITNKYKIIKSSIYYALFTSMPNILLFNIKIDTKKHIKYYLITSLITTLVGALIIYTLGPNLIKIFRFPEYMVLKQLKIFNFIEKLENLIGLVWFFDLFISSSLAFNNLNIINKNNRKVNFSIIILILFITEFVSTNYEYSMYIYEHLPLILFIFGLIYILTILINKKSSKAT